MHTQPAAVGAALCIFQTERGAEKADLAAMQLLPANPEAIVFLISPVASQLESTVTYE